jgi:hypothetical protein
MVENNSFIHLDLFIDLIIEIRPGGKREEK